MDDNQFEGVWSKCIESIKKKYQNLRNMLTNEVNGTIKEGRLEAANY